MQTTWQAGRALHVTLDAGWGDHPDRRLDWRKTTAGAARYRDLIDAMAAAADLLIVEVGLAEPDNGDTASLGATRNPREWIDLLDGRRLLLVRLSTSWPTLRRSFSTAVRG